MSAVRKLLINLAVDIFETDITVGVNLSEAKFRQRFKRLIDKNHHAEAWEPILHGWDSTGPSVGRTGITTAGVVVLLRIRNVVKDAGVIAHEMSHVVTEIMSRCGVRDDEARSYMLGYLVQKCVDEITHGRGRHA